MSACLALLHVMVGAVALFRLAEAALAQWVRWKVSHS